MRPPETCQGCGRALITSRRPLTTRQAQVLHIIRRSVKERGCAPTYDEILRETNLRSTATIAEHVANLEKKGYVLRDYHSGRQHLSLVEDDSPEVVELRNRIIVLEAELQLVSRLAAPTPQFSSPLSAWNAEAIRDRVLAEYSAARSAEKAS